MRTLFLFTFIIFSSQTSWAQIEEAKNCMRKGVIYSLNMKLQLIMQNQTADSTVSFSCMNLNHSNRKEFMSQRKDEINTVVSTMRKLKTEGAVSLHDFSFLGTPLGSKELKIDRLCPLIEKDYKKQIRDLAQMTFTNEMKKCPRHKQKIIEQYESVLSSTKVLNTDPLEICQGFLEKIENMRFSWQDNCKGSIIDEGPSRKTFGTFKKVGFMSKK